MNKREAEKTITYIYKYIEDRAHELPCDLSENAFWGELQESKAWVHVSRQNLAGIFRLVNENIFYDIYKNRAVNHTTKVVSGDDSISKQRNQIYGEVSDLLRAIVVAYDKHKETQKEKLAKWTFEELALFLSQKEDSEMMQNYAYLSILHNDCVKRSMLSQFSDELTKRLQTINRLVTNQSLHWKANHLMVTLHRLDAIIVDLKGATHNIQEYFEEHPNEDEYRGEMSRSLNELYFELRSARERSYIRNNAGRTKQIKFSLPDVDGTSNADIIHDIENILSSTSMAENKRRQKFAAAYNRYLFAANKDSEAIKDGEQFYKEYLALKKYTREAPSIDDFEMEIREELKRMAFRTFAPVISEDYIPHYYIETRFSHARYAFAYTQLINAQDQIRFKVHRALQLLSATYTIVGLLQVNDQVPCVKSTSDEEISKLLDIRNETLNLLLGTELKSRVKQIVSERERLYSEYPNSSLMYRIDRQSIQCYVQQFNDNCSDMFGVAKLETERIEKLSTELIQATDPLRILYIQSAFLQSECMMIINEEIEKTVAVLRDEYLRLEPQSKIK